MQPLSNDHQHKTMMLPSLEKEDDDVDDDDDDDDDDNNNGGGDISGDVDQSVSQTTLSDM